MRETAGMTRLDTRHVVCPTCRKRGAWFAGKFGPFCSERCKLVDLGRWLGEEYRLSSPLRLEHLEHLEDLPSTPEESPPRSPSD